MKKYNEQSYQEVEYVNLSNSTWYGASQNLIAWFPYSYFHKVRLA